MKTVAADSLLSLVWPDAFRLLEPAMKRTPGKPDVLAALRAHDAQLWLIAEGGEMIAAVVTRVQDRDGERQCLLWQVGGSRVREWAADFMASLEPWARSVGCTRIYGTGRRGWARITPLFSGYSIEPIDGMPAWERRIA